MAKTVENLGVCVTKRNFEQICQDPLTDGCLVLLYNLVKF